MKSLALLMTIAVVIFPRATGAQDEGVTSTALALTPEQFAAYWPGCDVDEVGATEIHCDDRVRARIAEGRVVEIVKEFDPPVPLVDAKAWMATAVPSDAQVAPTTVAADPEIVAEQLTSAGLGYAVGASTIVVRYVVAPDRERISSASVNAEGR
jgi:hypothetical protein